MLNKVLSGVLTVVTLSACAATPPPATRYVAKPAAYVGTGVQGPVAGTGVESQDIDAMVDVMSRDLLATQEIAGRTVAPRILCDDSDFQNVGSQAFDKGMITDSIRVKLNRASKGRMVFVDRDSMARTLQERELKRSGVTDVGTTGLTKALAGADFRLKGKIRQLVARNNNNGMIQRRTQVTFEMVDNESGVLVWSNEYMFTKAGADDIVYQ
ncbi:MAG: hypothetical protein RLZZ200_2664 [Pseudomonadota bacterium]|jgi:curli biogenesis system outer membrane secretion channel CsgG